MRLLLDTNVLVWLLLADRRRVPTTAAEALEDAGNDVLISAASVWEMAIKRSLGKLRIGDGWQGAIHRLGFRDCPITAEHAAAVEKLPWLHRDPFDRLLIAQARAENATLVTADSRIPQYDVNTLWG